MNSDKFYIKNIKLFDKIKVNKLLVSVVVFFMAINSLIIYHIHQNFEPVINYTENFESPLEYVWGSTAGEVSLSENGAKLTFDGTEDKIYFHMFDTYMATQKYTELATVPEYVDTIQVDFKMTFKAGTMVTVYLEQFDANGARIEEVLLREVMNTDTIRADNDVYTFYPYSFKVKRDSKCETFNIVLDIRPNGEAGTISLSDIDLILK